MEFISLHLTETVVAGNVVREAVVTETVVEETGQDGPDSAPGASQKRP
jgi:hypothetical protein